MQRRAGGESHVGKGELGCHYGGKEREETEQWMDERKKGVREIWRGGRDKIGERRIERENIHGKEEGKGYDMKTQKETTQRE